jgi:hypothetical protein
MTDIFPSEVPACVSATELYFFSYSVGWLGNSAYPRWALHPKVSPELANKAELAGGLAWTAGLSFVHTISHP